MPWIHVSDVVKIISMALSDENYSGVYNLVAPDAVRNKDLVKTIGKILGRPTLFPPTPKLPLRIALEQVREVYAEVPEVTELVAFIEASTRGICRSAGTDPSANA